MAPTDRKIAYNKINTKPEDVFWCPSVNVDAFATACYDLDLQNLIRSAVGDSEYSLSRFTEIAQAVYEILR